MDSGAFALAGKCGAGGRMTTPVPFEPRDGIFTLPQPSQHRNDEYDEQAFDLLIRMQREHFWYAGRNRVLHRALQRELGSGSSSPGTLRAIDLGGGCGGWVEYLHVQEGRRFAELALADSSLRALALAGPIVSGYANRYQVDLLSLPWRAEWDLVFLLDVLEHIPEHETVIRQVAAALRPGGLLFVTTPALDFFWTYNDDLAHHQRRYNRADFGNLAAAAGLRLLRAEYFMFFLSPVLLMNRLLFRPPSAATPEQLHAHALKSHRIPARPVNRMLAALLRLEAAGMERLRYPWGTSILGVFQKPEGAAP